MQINKFIMSMNTAILIVVMHRYPNYKQTFIRHGGSFCSCALPACAFSMASSRLLWRYRCCMRLTAFTICSYMSPSDRASLSIVHTTCACQNSESVYLQARSTPISNEFITSTPPRDCLCSSRMLDHGQQLEHGQEIAAQTARVG